MRLQAVIGSSLLLAAAASAAAAQTGDDLRMEDARRVMDAATTYARAHAAPGGAIAVVDAGGAIVLFERLDGTFPAGSRIAVGKAQTAAAFRKPTKVFEDAINGGRTAMTALPDFFPLQGGVPLVAGGRVIGAIGVSGASSAEQDEEIAQAGAAAVAVRTADNGEAPSIELIGAARVDAAFAHGDPLIENGEFKVHASRREKPGEAEVHDRDTDVVYVVSGEATIVTGGQVVSGRDIAPGEIRGVGIDGGAESKIGPGDVFVVPRGVPHWFRQVTPPLTYYVIKVTGSKGASS